MAEGGEDKEQKTEQPSQKRLEEAVKRGQIPFSREVTHLFMLFTFAITIAWYLPSLANDLKQTLTAFLANAEDFPTDRRGLEEVFIPLLLKVSSVMFLPLLCAFAAAISASVIQNGLILSGEPLIPKWEKVSIFKGFSRLFSLRSVIELIKSLVKIMIVAGVGYMAIKPELKHLHQMVDDEIIVMLLFLSKLVVKLMVGVCVAMFFIAGADFLYQRFEYIKSLRMSKQEVKDEYKQQEGDPMIKRRLRQIRMERARKRMMAAVPDADVVITNPTHYAVALKYDNAAMAAPKVVAKGADYIALTMRRIAEENDVPVVQNPPLARALFDSVDIDAEVPIAHYQAVAEVISYVWRLKGKLPPEQKARR